jgi:hypothetical protein
MSNLAAHLHVLKLFAFPLLQEPIGDHIGHISAVSRRMVEPIGIEPMTSSLQS